MLQESTIDANDSEMTSDLRDDLFRYANATFQVSLGEGEPTVDTKAVDWKFRGLVQLQKNLK